MAGHSLLDVSGRRQNYGSMNNNKSPDHHTTNTMFDYMCEFYFFIFSLKKKQIQQNKMKLCQVLFKKCLGAW